LEHVLLLPDVTPSEVDDACAGAVEFGLAAVTVWPGDVPRAAAATDGSPVTVVAALGGSSATGGGSSATGGGSNATGGPNATGPASPTIDQARCAIRAGAMHLAVEFDPARMLGEGAAELARELRALCRMAHAEGVHVRAVLQAPSASEAGAESAWAAGVGPAGVGPAGAAARPGAVPSAARLAEAGRLAVEAGVDLLQTGFGVQAHATAEQVRAVRRALPSRHAAIGVIAGGAADADAARHLLERAGAVRVAVLDPTAVLRGVAAA
jgi:deoxyribose-phosphate aldolase